MKKPKKTNSILFKLLVVLLVISSLPLMINVYFSYNTLEELNQVSLQSSVDLENKLFNETSGFLVDAAADSIKQLAVDVAKQLEIYILDHPNMNVSELQNDAYFNSIAVQPVGKTGYTAITDVDTLTCRFHAKSTTINLDLHVLENKLPGFWGIMNATQGGIPADGYYDWEEPDGLVKQKYMYIAIVNATTADNIVFSVAATTYMEEFLSPVATLEEIISLGVKENRDNSYSLISTSQTITILIFVFSVFSLLIVGFILVRRLTRPILKLKEISKEIGRGNLNVKIDIKSNDEIGDLSLAFGKMADKLKKHVQNMEEQIAERTKELNEKVEKLERYKKVTVGREIKMAEMKKEIKELKDRFSGGRTD